MEKMSDNLIIVIVSTVVWIPFILTLRTAMLRCSPESRTLSPNLIWLIIIPFLTYVWAFVVVVKLAETLHNEFLKIKIEADKAPGRNLGLVASILSVIAIAPNIDLVGIAGVPAIICWIIYWIKIWRFSFRLKAPVRAAQPRPDKGEGSAP